MKPPIDARHTHVTSDHSQGMWECGNVELGMGWMPSCCIHCFHCFADHDSAIPCDKGQVWLRDVLWACAPLGLPRSFSRLWLLFASAIVWPETNGRVCNKGGIHVYFGLEARREEGPHICLPKDREGACR